ncbi:MAG TPA: hypothetical protein PKK06_16965 [Phycisphaerae bacterium]|nr:hypothetical protein [Phycisphaerae bacterium]HNU46235.1 hypothetical protein [Phycisphaerae bacterium]
MSQSLNFETFLGRPDAVATALAVGEMFGLLRRTYELPPPWAALVRRTTGDHVVVPAGACCEAGGAEEVLLVRTTPLELEFAEEQLTTQDRFQCQARVTVSVRVVPERAELLSLSKTVLGSERTATAATLRRYLQGALRQALVQAAGAQEAAVLVDGQAPAVEALSKALQGPCFLAGLVVEGTPRVRFDSETFRQVRQSEEQAARQQREHEASRQVQQALEQAQRTHLDHLAELLAKLKQLAAASPQAELGDLMRTFSEAQRGELYEALFATAPSGPRTAWIAVASGDELLFLDPSAPAAINRRVTISGSAGPLRSVQTGLTPEGRTVLLVGAATGVYQLAPEAAQAEVTFLVPDAAGVRGGFNAATRVGTRLFATHSELGLLEWSIDAPASPRRRFAALTQSAKSVRCVQLLGGDLYGSIDDHVLRWPADDVSDQPAQVYTEAGGQITAVCPTPIGLLAGNRFGQLLFWPEPAGSAPQVVHTGSGKPVESAVLLTTGGVRRVVFTDGSPYVHARVLGDNFTCRYEAPGQMLRRVEVADDLLVGMNDLRDRLICWRPGTPGVPSATVSVGALCGRSIQDACLIPETPH